MNKITVYYKDLHSAVEYGHSALVTPVNHPSPYVSNTGPALTSCVIMKYDDGSFETLNTIYKPIPTIED